MDSDRDCEVRGGGVRAFVYAVWCACVCACVCASVATKKRKKKKARFKPSSASYSRVCVASAYLGVESGGQSILKSVIPVTPTHPPAYTEQHAIC